MLDFRVKKPSQPKVRSYLGSREQKRLLLMVGMLALVFVLMGKANNPRVWNWMFAGVGVKGAEANDHGRDRTDGPSLAGLDAVDTRLRPTRQAPEALDVIRIEVPPDVTPSAPGVRKRLCPGVQPEWLTAIRDDTVLRGTEHDALYSLFGVLAAADEAALAKSSSGPVGYLQLFKQPDEYRGELVTLRGTVHQAEYRKAPANQHGIEGFYKLVLSPTDHPAGLIFVDVLELPTGFPTGEDIKTEVEIVGLSYKRWAYTAQDGIRTAPLVLAKTLAWTKPAATNAAVPFDWTLFIVGGLVAGVACLAAIGWMFRLKPTHSRLRTSEAQTGEVLRQLAVLEDTAIESIHVEKAL